jgi:hypothetical protein
VTDDFFAHNRSVSATMSARWNKKTFTKNRMLFAP